MRALVRLLLLAAAVSLGTTAIGWLGVVLVGLLWGVVSQERSGALTVVGVAAAAGVAGWAVLFLGHSLAGELGAVVALLGEILPLPGPVLVLFSLLMAGLLASLSAWLGWEVRRLSPFLTKRRRM